LEDIERQGDREIGRWRDGDRDRDRDREIEIEIFESLKGL